MTKTSQYATLIQKITLRHVPHIVRGSPAFLSFTSFSKVMNPGSGSGRFSSSSDSSRTVKSPASSLSKTTKSPSSVAFGVSFFTPGTFSFSLNGVLPAPADSGFAGLSSSSSSSSSSSCSSFSGFPGFSRSSGNTTVKVFLQYGQVTSMPAHSSSALNAPPQCGQDNVNFAILLSPPVSIHVAACPNRSRSSFPPAAAVRGGYPSLPGR